MKDTNKLHPEIRFSGFTDDWEQRKLGELGEIMTGSTPPTAMSKYYSEHGIPWVTPTDIEGNIISDTSKKLSEEGVKVGRVVPANTILCTCIASIGKNALLTVKGSFNQQINSLTPSQENNPYFLLTESELWSKELKRIAGAGTMQIVNKSEFSELSTMVPRLDEQQKIGEYFSNLDHLITLHQRKLDKLKTLKKAMLEKMFPKNGESIPEIRFSGFTDDWEQRKLGEFADIVTGKLDANAMKEDGKYDFYTSGIQKYKIDVPAFEGPAITIAGNGATVGYMHLADGKFNAYQRTYVLSAFQANRKFLFYEIGNKLPQKIAQEARTGNIPYIVMDMLTDLQIFIPPEHEQSKIGEYFSNLDRLITLHQRKLDKLKTLKKAMLEKMFI
ncbi:restriction endonuclease subunit S [uncultured Streptococcus sp.]|uniref:restriction endonuclease subunit S n=1 Tax=uncultured Streptococcus sp. TaxID=83427 RepID=UPI0026DAF968|nr:restriction endonuclease subunit S [uncultured Streptococcus sp.]